MKRLKNDYISEIDEKLAQINEKIKPIHKIPEWEKSYLTLGKQIKLIRKYYGLSQKKLGELSGISQYRIAQIENDAANPTLKTLEQLSDALNGTLKVFIFPEDTLEKVVYRKALALAKKIVRSTQGSSALECQAPSPKAIRQEIKRQTALLIKENRGHIWDAEDFF